MSRKAVRAASRHATPAPSFEGIKGISWFAAVGGAMVLAAVLAWFTAAGASGNTTQSLPMAAKAPRAGLADAGQKISVDPATGQARPIEHDDVTPSAAASRTADEELQQVAGPNGAEGVMVPDTSDVYTVATKAPDGRVSIGHAVGLTDAQRRIQATDKARRGAAKEELHDR